MKHRIHIIEPLEVLDQSDVRIRVLITHLDPRLGHHCKLSHEGGTVLVGLNSLRLLR